MSKPRLQLSTLAISLSVLCVGFGVLAIERQYADAAAPLWLLPRVFGGAIAGAGVGFAVGELVGGRRGAMIGIASGLLLGWNAAMLSATAMLVRNLP